LHSKFSGYPFVYGILQRKGDTMRTFEQPSISGEEIRKRMDDFFSNVSAEKLLSLLEEAGHTDYKNLNLPSVIDSGLIDLQEIPYSDKVAVTTDSGLIDLQESPYFDKVAVTVTYKISEKPSVAFSVYSQVQYEEISCSWIDSLGDECPMAA